MDIRAIETEYNGYRFRSRLEARWAVFFDTAKIKYEYEPEGFTAGDGEEYLPDFYLPESDIYVEVKPNRPGAAEEVRRAINVMLNNRQVLIVLPDIPYDTSTNVWWFPVFFHHPLCGSSGCRMTFLPFCSSDNSEEDDHLRVITSFADGIRQSLYWGNVKQIEKELKAVNDTELDPPIVESFDPETYEPIYHREPQFTVREAYDSPFLGKCYLTARQARFEHGETPKIKS